MDFFLILEHGHRLVAIELALVALRLVAAQMRPSDVGAHQFPFAGHFESLRRGFVRLDFWNEILSCIHEGH